jgi:hypothetical protein
MAERKGPCLRFSEALAGHEVYNVFKRFIVVDVKAFDFCPVGIPTVGHGE